MFIWGSIFGAALGYFVGGIIGAIIGFFIGRFFDRGLQTVSQSFNPENVARIQAIFFKTLFSTMGHLAKADGRVTEDEIAVARAIMQQMRLNEDQRQEAMAFFNQGKAADFDLEAQLLDFKKHCHWRRDLVLMFLEVQIATIFADGVQSAEEQQVLYRIGTALGIRQAELDKLVKMVQAQRNYYQQGGQPGVDPQKLLSEAYGVLGVAETASDKEVKLAYRKLMSQHHPDKLVSKGLPEEMMELAKEKAQEIQSAYDLISKTRKNR